MTSGTQLAVITPAGWAADEAARCTVVIVTYQSERHLPRLLTDLRSEAATVGLRVLVVDNSSSDGTVALAEEAGVQVVQTGANLGYAGALNAAAAYTAPDRPVLVLNPDLSIEPGAVATLLAAVTADRRIGIAVPTILDDDGSVFPSLRREPSIPRAAADALLGRRAARLPGPSSEIVWDRAAYERPGAADWATGAAMMITAECARRVGSWDEDRFFLYSEETDYSRRARVAGLRIGFVPGARVQHSGGGSGTSPALAALMGVNRVRYYRKFHGPVATRAFAGIVVLHELLRSRDAAHRAALLALLKPSRRHALVPQDARRGSRA